MPLPEHERAAIEAAISRAERKTSGEIVVVATRVSSRYYGIALLWAALAALSVPLPLILFTHWPVEYIYLIQLAVFALGVALLQWEPLRFAVVPKSAKHARAHKRAVEEFLAAESDTPPRAAPAYSSTYPSPSTSLNLLLTMPSTRRFRRKHGT